MTGPISLSGCFSPIPTPFDVKGRVDHDHLALNLEKWQKTPLAGSVVLGSNGEAVLLTTEEKIAVWKTAGEVIRPGHLFIAGAGCEATGRTIELTEKAAALGAHAAMVVTPHYYKGKMDHRALVRHYTAIADRSPIPIILYNVPASTGVDMTAETLPGTPASSGSRRVPGMLSRWERWFSKEAMNFRSWPARGVFFCRP